jgi:hypothetical protein
MSGLGGRAQAYVDAVATPRRGGVALAVYRDQRRELLAETWERPGKRAPSAKSRALEALRDLLGL